MVFIAERPSSPGILHNNTVWAAYSISHGHVVCDGLSLALMLDRVRLELPTCATVFAHSGVDHDCNIVTLSSAHIGLLRS